MKYKRYLPIVLPLLLLIPGVSRAARSALLGISDRLPFPAALLAIAYLAFRFRARRVIAAAEIVALLYFPLLGNAPYPIPVRFEEEQIFRLCLSLSRHAEAYAASEPLSFSEVADECRRLSGGSVKLSRFPEWMTLTHTAGIFIPLTGEALLNPREPTFTFPFLALHEIAHQSGLMNEGQASVRAYLWAMSSEKSAFRYSASIEALRRSVSVLYDADPQRAVEFVRALSPRLERDLNALGALRAEKRAFFRFAGDYGDLAKYLIGTDAGDL